MVGGYALTRGDSDGSTQSEPTVLLISELFSSKGSSFWLGSEHGGSCLIPGEWGVFDSQARGLMKSGFGILKRLFPTSSQKDLLGRKSFI